MRNLPYIVMILVGMSSGSIHAQAAFRDGFYTALSGGINCLDGSWSGLSSISLVDDIHDPNSLFRSWTPKGTTQDGGRVCGAVALGYQLVDKPLYLAVQVGGTFRSPQHFILDDFRSFENLGILGNPPFSLLTGTAATHSKVTLGCCAFDIDLKPGFLIRKNVLFYARTGLTYARLKIENEGVWTQMSSENRLELSASGSSRNSKNKVGYRVGGGAEFLINRYLGLSIDYIYSDYGKIKSVAQGIGSQFFAFSEVYGILAPIVKVTTHTVMASLVVHY